MFIMMGNSGSERSREAAVDLDTGMLNQRG